MQGFLSGFLLTAALSGIKAYPWGGKVGSVGCVMVGPRSRGGFFGKCLFFVLSLALVELWLLGSGVTFRNSGSGRLYPQHFTFVISRFSGRRCRTPVLLYNVCFFSFQGWPRERLNNQFKVFSVGLHGWGCPPTDQYKGTVHEVVFCISRQTYVTMHGSGSSYKLFFHFCCAITNMIR